MVERRKIEKEHVVDLMQIAFNFGATLSCSIFLVVIGELISALIVALVSLLFAWAAFSYFRGLPNG